MKKKWLFMILIAFYATCGDRPRPEAAENTPPGRGGREPILAGTWYPGEAGELRRSIQGYLAAAGGGAVQGELRGLIVPHAGHMYSGQVAAHAYSLLQGMPVERVILIGPSHRFGFKGISVDLQSGYRTPLGTVPVDREFAKKLIEADPTIRDIPQAHSLEHSLEIQVPFLQVVLKRFHLVPIVMGQQDLDTCTRLAGALNRVLGEDRTSLVIASTDLSHFHHDSRARELDKEFIRNVEIYDPEGLSRSLSAGRCEACGGGPAVAAMLTARSLGADRAVLLRYATSGDVTGDRRQVVGYVSAALVKGK
ncbi:MAG: AmmeMemoRadiSam system protein B [Thermodesulfobacteriota bacterium]